MRQCFVTTIGLSLLDCSPLSLLLGSVPLQHPHGCTPCRRALDSVLESARAQAVQQLVRVEHEAAYAGRVAGRIRAVGPGAAPGAAQRCAFFPVQPRQRTQLRASRQRCTALHPTTCPMGVATSEGQLHYVAAGAMTGTLPLNSFRVPVATAGTRGSSRRWWQA